jgi:type I restriction enzyme S subunit
MSGANYPALTNQQVENLLIPRPPLPEQKAIAQRLLEIDNLIENRKKEKKKIERAKKKVMDMLLSGRVRVRVNKNEG